MSLPLRSLPIVEHWDCHSCARCCRGSIIPLTQEDLAKIVSQRWHEQPEFRGSRIVVRRSLANRQLILAKRPDGACVFLMDDGRCRIHLEHGLEAKPIVCQTYPLQLVPHDTAAYFPLRRSCPSAAAGRGRAATLDRPDIRRLLQRQQDKLQPRAVPPVTARIRLPWKTTGRVLQTLGRLMTDSHYPIVRRVVHALLVCDALEQCDPRRLEERQYGELLSMLADSALEEASPFFRDRTPPARSTLGLFRQSVFHFLRLHPCAKLRETWRDRLALTTGAWRFLRGRGVIPRLGTAAAPATFESLEEPLGPLDPRIMEPLNLFLETSAASSRYVLLRPSGWNVVDGFRSLALTYAAGMWLARFFSHEAELTRDAMVDIVVALDRGQGFEPLTGSRHRHRIRGLSRPGQLAGLVAWYAR